MIDFGNDKGTFGKLSGGRTRNQPTIHLGPGASVRIVLFRRWGIADVSCFCFTVSACEGTPPVQPSASPSPSVVPGSPVTGSVTNGGSGGFERAYFRNIRTMVPVFFVFVSLSAPLAATMSLV